MPKCLLEKFKHKNYIKDLTTSVVVCATFPKMQESITSGPQPFREEIAPRAAIVPSSTADLSFKEPPNAPKAVRLAATMYTDFPNAIF